MDHNKALRVAEMIRGALVPLERYEGVPTRTWQELSASEQRTEAALVQGIAAQMRDNEINVPNLPEDQIRYGIISVMYHDELKLSPADKEIASQLSGPAPSDPRIVQPDDRVSPEPTSPGTVIK